MVPPAERGTFSLRLILHGRRCVLAAQTAMRRVRARAGFVRPRGSDRDNFTVRSKAPPGCMVFSDQVPATWFLRHRDPPPGVAREGSRKREPSPCTGPLPARSGSSDDRVAGGATRVATPVRSRRARSPRRRRAGLARLSASSVMRRVRSSSELAIVDSCGPSPSMPRIFSGSGAGCTATTVSACSLASTSVVRATCAPRCRVPSPAATKHRSSSRFGASWPTSATAATTPCASTRSDSTVCSSTISLFPTKNASVPSTPISVDVRDALETAAANVADFARAEMAPPRHATSVTGSMCGRCAGLSSAPAATCPADAPCTRRPSS